ncbi:anoctamin-3-like [Agrilus planipennis]|uniref:Anoctamin n=1 Tax=Agrilus planipennis TaxID=224129 RepID=A0A1W4XGN4_AGRPL|nr:anoctamin-3-like [Agrilus planipennis]
MTTQYIILDNTEDYIPVSCCFRDKKRRIHLVIAVSAGNIDEKLGVFVENLKSQGVHVEEDFGVYDNEIKFIKLHLPDDKAAAFAKAYQIDCYYERRQFWTEQNPNSYLRKFFPFHETSVVVNERNPMYQKSTFELNKSPTSITYSEVSYVLYKLLNETHFGDKQFEFGVDRLLNKKIALSIYSLHEGQWQWTVEGGVSSRQILAKYWSNSKMCYKQQPMNSVTRYFGTEVAHFFGLLGFYIKMVFPLAIAGILCVIWGVSSINTIENQASLDVCKSDIVLCPRCDNNKCRYKWLHSACFNMHLTYLVDNAGSFVYGLFVLFWAVIFHRLWLRRKNTYTFLWNVDKEIDIAIRLEYEKKARSKRTSYFTGLEEPHMPVKEKLARLALSWSTLFLLVFSILSTLILSAMMRVWFELYFNQLGSKHELYIMESNRFYAMIINSSTSSLCVILMTEFYRYLSSILTEFETPRTKTEFGYSYIVKLYVLEFANHYGSLFYIAFVKGRLYTHPGDQSSNPITYILRNDHCTIPGCLNDLNVNLLVRIWFFIGRSFLKPIIRRLVNCFRFKCRPKTIPFDTLPQWEADYYMTKVPDTYLINRQLKIVIIHGYMTLFALVSPLAPLFILIYALMELRLEAKQYIKNYRRPILTKITTSTVFSDLFMLTAYIGVVTNACILAFTTSFVEREVYRYSDNSSLYGFFYSTLSVFNATQYNLDQRMALVPIPTNLTECYYQGKRYPPEHARQYQRREHFWIEYFYKFLVVIVVEHLVLIVITILEVVSSPIPYHVKQRMRLEWIQKKERQRT